MEVGIPIPSKSEPIHIHFSRVVQNWELNEVSDFFFLLLETWRYLEEYNDLESYGLQKIFGLVFL